MKRALASCCLLLLCAACAHGPDTSRPEMQDNFGVEMAKMSLWREALFRFQRTVDLKPEDAMARNNLAVAYEASGDFDKARREYLVALKLDKSNQYIQKNYSRYVEFLSRNKKRQQKTAVARPPGASPSPLVPSVEGAAQPDSPPSIIPPSKPAPPPPVTPPSDRPPAAPPRPRLGGLP